MYFISIKSYTQCIYIAVRHFNKLHIYTNDNNMFKYIQIDDAFNEVKHDYIPKNIFRKSIEGYLDSFDVLTIKKIILNHRIFMSNITTNM